jgi:tripartite-type tricarboxylate transporter receptor subunit TctC
MSSDTKVCMLTKNAGLQRLEDLGDKKATIGATGQGSGQIYGLILRQLYGDNVKIVMGYPSTNDIALAMERGEVDGMCTGWGVVEVTKPDWIRRDFVSVLTQFASHRDRRLPDTPLIHESSLPAGMSQTILFLTAPDMVTRPFIAPPSIPQERSAALRLAFNKAMKDPDLHAFAQKTSLDLDPMTGEELENLIAQVFSVSPQALDFARKILK